MSMCKEKIKLEGRVGEPLPRPPILGGFCWACCPGLQGPPYFQGRRAFAAGRGQEQRLRKAVIAQEPHSTPRNGLAGAPCFGARTPGSHFSAAVSTRIRGKERTGLFQGNFMKGTQCWQGGSPPGSSLTFSAYAGSQGKGPGSLELSHPGWQVLCPSGLSPYYPPVLPVLAAELSCQGKAVGRGSSCLGPSTPSSSAGA